MPCITLISLQKEFYARVIAGEIIEEQEQFVDNVILQVNSLKKMLLGSKFHFNSETDIRLLIGPDISATSLNSNIAIDAKSSKDRNMEFEADNWLQSRSSRKSQNYMISYPEDRYVVYIATEIVLLKEYGLLINDTVIYSEDDENQINELKEYLDSIDCFKELYTLAPESSIDSFMGKINDLVAQWKTYEIFDTNTGVGIKLDAVYLKTHIKQYIRFRQGPLDFSVFLNGYLKMLSQMCIVSKEDIAVRLNHNFKAILDKEKCEKSELVVCNIGTLQDSSAIIAYHMNIVNQCLVASWETNPLDKVLEKAMPGQRIVFLEDAFCSGKQILSVFETYMGVPIDERQTKEEHVKELPPTMKDRLRECKLFFSFLFYQKEQERFFYDRLNEIGVCNVCIISRDVFPMGYFRNKANVEDQNELEVVKRYMEQAGQLLINSKAHEDDGKRKPGWSDERINKSSLGYNDAQQLVAFSWNTPTYTMTPLWMGVDKTDFKWIPLFPRINK